MTMQRNSATKRPRKMAREPQPTPSTVQFSANAPKVAKPEFKSSKVEKLLQREKGTSLEEMCQLTGWQPHTCRAFLTGLRKKGKVLDRYKREDGATIYKLTGQQAAS